VEVSKEQKRSHGLWWSAKSWQTKIKTIIFTKLKAHYLGGQAGLAEQAIVKRCKALALREAVA